MLSLPALRVQSRSLLLLQIPEVRVRHAEVLQVQGLQDQGGLQQGGGEEAREQADLQRLRRAAPTEPQRAHRRGAEDGAQQAP